ncbi:MAG: alpha-amylase family glycosyl hydrolase [Cyanobacteria bacterium P01_E01_bin.6]
MQTSPDSVFDPIVINAINEARSAALGQTSSVRPPFPSPIDWRDHWIYFLMIDRFNHPINPPVSAWNQPFGRHQGGSFKGIEQRLDYLQNLGVGAIWITPVVKNPAPDWEYNYHGYAAQDLLAIDARFGSDGTQDTAERELRELVDAAHDRGIYVILDIVLNHMARVFDYWINGNLVDSFQNESILRSEPLSGREPEIAWLNGLGFPRVDWTGLPPDASIIHPDDAVHPALDFRKDFFRRRGEKTSDEPNWPNEQNGFAIGDFGTMRQLVVEYEAEPTDNLYKRWGANPVLTLLVRAYSFLIARYDFDAFRIDTAKYVDPTMLQFFGNAMREFALSVGKRNFFTFGEIWDDEATLARFVGRNGNVKEGFGIDAAKDFPLFQAMKTVPKALESGNVSLIPALFDKRKQFEKELLSSHGEASRFFVTFLDNHDQSERFRHPLTPDAQVTLALGLLYTLQGIPCLYYGTEQDLSGTVDSRGNHVRAMFEGVREALWGKSGAFSTDNITYQYIQKLSNLRKAFPALRYGRQYFRPVSGNGIDFGMSTEVGGILSFSRILGDLEVLVVANTSPTQTFNGSVLVDQVINNTNTNMRIELSNLGTALSTISFTNSNANFWVNGVNSGSFPATHVQVALEPMELQVLTQVI